MSFRLAYIAAGAAGMYCGSCIHDNTLARALIRRGIDVALVPTYTPIRTDEEDVSEDRVFFGGINVYLQHKSALFRHTPWLFDRLLDRPGLLNRLGKLSSSTSPEDLGGLTVSMLEGKAGPQAKELDKLIHWLREFRPDIVQLTNSIFLGLADPIQQALGIPVIVAFQGEDIFLDALVEPYRTRARELMVQHAARAMGFVATSDYCASAMSAYVEVDREKVDVVPLGIDLRGYPESRARNALDEIRIGYLARICPEKGLHILVEAFYQLVQNSDRDLTLHVAGWLGKKDETYCEGVKRQASSWGVEDRIEYTHDFSRKEKVAFLRDLDILSVPTPYQEAKGLFALESMACGVPVVLPNHGSYPEYIAKTEGGILVDTLKPADVATGILRLIDDPDLRMDLSAKGAAGVRAYYNDDRMAEDAIKVYERHIGISSR